jgi:hypothetical protein
MGTIWSGRQTESGRFTEKRPSTGLRKCPVTRIPSAFIGVHLRFHLRRHG